MSDGYAAHAKRAAEMAAIFMIGNGVLGLLQPERRVALWTSDRAWIDSFVRADRERPLAERRTLGLLQIGAGVALASRLR